MPSDMRVVVPRINYAASTRDLLHEVRLIQASLGAQIDRLEGIERDLQILLRTCSAGDARTIVSGADQVAYNLHTRPLPDGSVEIAIDGGAKFSFGPRLADVFQFFASGDKDRSGKDPLVGWRSRADIIRFLEESMGRIPRASYVNNLVHLLKRSLRRAGYDPSLIQTHRQKGVRFALKVGARGPQDSSLPGWH